MASYRLYFVNAAGHFTEVVDMDAADDAEAICRVEETFGGRATELWQLGRCVKKFSTTA